MTRAWCKLYRIYTSMNIEMARQEYEREREAKRKSKIHLERQIYKKENCERRVIDKKKKQNGHHKREKEMEKTKIQKQTRERRGLRH